MDWLSLMRCVTHHFVLRHSSLRLSLRFGSGLHGMFWLDLLLLLHLSRLWRDAQHLHVLVQRTVQRACRAQLLPVHFLSLQRPQRRNARDGGRLVHKHQTELGFIAFSQVCQMVDERGLLIRLELHLNRDFGFAVLAEQHPAGGGLFRHLLDHAEAPPRGFQLQNKGTGCDWIELACHCY